MSDSLDLQLSRYFDDELPSDEAAELEAELANNEALRAKLDGLSHLSSLLRAGLEGATDNLDDDALFSRLSARLSARREEDETDGDDPMLPVSEQPALRLLRSRSNEPGPGRPTAPSRIPEQRTRTFVLAGVFAAAAAVLLGVIAPPPDSRPSASSADADHLATHRSEGSEPDQLAGLPPAGSEVETIDFGYSTGAVFSVEGNGGERYAVVWISDEKVDEDEVRVQ